MIFSSMYNPPFWSHRKIQANKFSPCVATVLSRSVARWQTLGWVYVHARLCLCLCVWVHTVCFSTCACVRVGIGRNHWGFPSVFRYHTVNVWTTILQVISYRWLPSLQALCLGEGPQCPPLVPWCSGLEQLSAQMEWAIASHMRPSIHTHTDTQTVTSPELAVLLISCPTAYDVRTSFCPRFNLSTFCCLSSSTGLHGGTFLHPRCEFG